MKCVNMNIMSVEICTPPRLGFCPGLVITICNNHPVLSQSAVETDPERPTPEAPPQQLLGCSGRLNVPWHDPVSVPGNRIKQSMCRHRNNIMGFYAEY